MKHSTLIIILTLNLLSINISNASTLPDLGASDLKDYNKQTETALGRAFSTALYQHYDLVKDPVILSYIRRIGNKIASETGHSRHFSFHVINNSEINAFAGPNGIIGINTGLINAAKSEDEIASVIAHEIAHVTQRHLSRTYEYQNATSVTSIATLIAAILIGTQDPSAGLATYLGAQGLSIQHQLKNSRIHESEADYFGIKYLQDAGYNPEAMANFFDRLSKSAQIYEFKPPEILQTHPVTASRMARAKERAFQVQTEKKPFKTKTLRLIQIRLVKLEGTRPDNYQNISLTPSEKCYENNLQARYNDTSPLKPNLNCLETAISNHPTQRLYKIQKANLLSFTAPKKSFTEYKYLQAIYPSDFSIPYFYATALNRDNKKNEAIQVLQNITPSFHYQFLLYSKLARFYSDKREKDKVYYYDALANYNIGN